MLFVPVIDVGATEEVAGVEVTSNWRLPVTLELE
jgi:hypothetical protein